MYKNFFGATSGKEATDAEEAADATVSMKGPRPDKSRSTEPTDVIGDSFNLRAVICHRGTMIDGGIANFNYS